MGKTAFITGITGQYGSCLAEFLRAKRDDGHSRSCGLLLRARATQGRKLSRPMQVFRQDGRRFHEPIGEQLVVRRLSEINYTMYLQQTHHPK